MNFIFSQLFSLLSWLTCSVLNFHIALCHPYQVQGGLSFSLDIDCNIKLDIKKKIYMFFLLNFDLLEMLLSTCAVSIKSPVKRCLAQQRGVSF